MKYADKKFIINYLRKTAEKYNNIYYYCPLHRTTKFSNTFRKNNTKKKVNLCNAKILYKKDTKEYFICNDHSTKCLELGKTNYDNKEDINCEINNYKKYKELLIDYLNKNPLIKYKDFRYIATKLYDESKCNFNVENYTFSNIYYTWRSKSNLFNKFSIFTNNKTTIGNIYLRDYTYKYIYNKTGKKLLIHEHAIFISDFFIKKLREVLHFYIVDTFIYPPGFKQLLVILYYDQKNNKRFPGGYILINNKTECCYIEIFKSFRSIVTIENTKSLKVKGITTDFELGLINAVKSIFSDVKYTGCFFHYVRAVTKKFKILKLHKIKISEDSHNILHNLFILPYNYHKKDDIDRIFENVIKKNNEIGTDNKLNKVSEIYLQFKNYFIKTWLEFFENGTFDYRDVDKKFRSKRFIENYSKRIKIKLSDYLYGYRKTKISWPLFNYFILHEEEEYRTDNINFELSVEIKEYNNNLLNDFNTSTTENINDNIVNIYINLKFLKYRQNSCRYDTFFYMYILIIKSYLETNKIQLNTNLNVFDLISDNIINLDIDDLDNGIWNIIDKYKENYPFLKEYYKQENSIT